jgi:hypothetical protein
MPKKKIAQIDRQLNGKTTSKKRPARPSAGIQPLAIVAATPPAVAADLSQFPPGFENKAGRYELIRVDGGQAYYSFTNHQEKTVDATMSVVTWRKMQERAEAALKETA